MTRDAEVTWIGGLKAEAKIGRHRLVVDEPVEKGGDDSGPTPVDLLLAALGT